ncbi:Spindle assembly checkpoint protein [Phaffia rhodozyma]|uniref:Spindle assembly checkpoint protein n=1 Tax=Phaffia rhodozyma TaxID=264483 RepID=A0A0F7SXW4_PHARH|nr:Spindle assembly checkpoint protein [Phaffia rhodozyma]
MATKQAQKQAISLKGSTKIVTEFFDYSVNNILYQRGIYPSDDFKMVKKYGLPMLMTTDDNVKAYLASITEQVHAWLMSGQITRLVLAIISKDTRETLERWQFDVKMDASSTEPNPSDSFIPAGSGQGSKPKTEKQVQAEIREIMKQITSSVTFLPMLDEPCTFNILAYTSLDTDGSTPLPTPEKWVESDAHLIDAAKVEQVRLRSFSTNVHKLEAMVAYKLD